MLAGSKGCEFNSALWLDSDSFEAMMALLNAGCEIGSQSCVETKGIELNNTSETIEGGCRRQVKEGARFEDVYMHFDIKEIPIFGEMLAGMGFTLNEKIFSPKSGQPAWGMMQSLGVCKWGSRAGYLFASGTGLINGLTANFNLGKADIGYAASLKKINDLGENPADKLVAAKATLKDEISKSSSAPDMKATKESELAALTGAEEDLAVTYARASVGFIEADAAGSELLKMLTGLGMDEQTAMVIYSLAPAYTKDGTELNELCVRVAVEKLVENNSISRSWGNVIIAFKKIVDISAAIQKASEDEGVKAVDAEIAAFEASAGTMTEAQRNQMVMALTIKRAQAIKAAIGPEKASKLIASFKEAIALLQNRKQLTTPQGALLGDFASSLEGLGVYMAIFASDSGETAEAPTQVRAPDTRKAKANTGSGAKKSGGASGAGSGKAKDSSGSGGGKTGKAASKTNYGTICNSTIAQRAQDADLRAAYSKAIKEGKCN